MRARERGATRASRSRRTRAGRRAESLQRSTGAATATRARFAVAPVAVRGGPGCSIFCRREFDLVVTISLFASDLVGLGLGRLTSPSSYLVSLTCNPAHSFTKSRATWSSAPARHSIACGWKMGRGAKNATDRSVRRTRERIEIGNAASSGEEAAKSVDWSMYWRSAWSWGEWCQVRIGKSSKRASVVRTAPTRFGSRRRLDSRVECRSWLPWLSGLPSIPASRHGRRRGPPRSRPRPSRAPTKVATPRGDPSWWRPPGGPPRRRLRRFELEEFRRASEPCGARRRE